MRNASILILSMIWLYFAKINPFSGFPWHKRYTVLTRSAIGQLSFLVFNASLKLVPMTIHIILFQTNTFWISILAYFVNSEPILPIEIIGMLICFLAVVSITLSSGTEEQAMAGDPYESYRSLGYVLVLAGAWIFATTNVLNRVLKELHHA